MPLLGLRKEWYCIAPLLASGKGCLLLVRVPVLFKDTGRGPDQHTGPTHRTQTSTASHAHSTARPGTAAITRPKTGRGNQRAQAPSTGPGRASTITLSHVQRVRDQARAHRSGRLGRHYGGRQLQRSQKAGEAVAVTRETRAGRGCAERGRG